MSSTLPDSSAKKQGDTSSDQQCDLSSDQESDISSEEEIDISLEKQVAKSSEQQIGSLSEQQLATLPEQQLATLPQQQITSFNTNGQIQEKKNPQNKVKDQTENLSLMATSINKMEQFFSKFRSTKEQLKSILTLIPSNQIKSSKENNENNEQDDLNEAYSDFRKSISQIGCAYSELSDIYFQFQSSFNLVKADLCAIYRQTYEKIKSNQVLSDNFMDIQKKKISNAETLINDLKEKQNNFLNNLRNKHFEDKVSLLLSKINKGSQIKLNEIEETQLTTEQRRRNKELFDQQSKLELLETEMKFSEQQEKRLKKDYQTTTNQLREAKTLNKKQQDNLDQMGTDKNKLIKLIQEQITKNKVAKEQMSSKIIQDHFNRNQTIEKIFSNTLQQINDLKLTQGSRGFIVVLDESGSMSGQPFQSCILAIKEQVRYLKSKFQNDEFCMIQFDSKARITINISAVQYVKETDIGKTMNGGGTDFYEAFRLVKEVIPLFDCNIINIMFVTDGGDSNTSKYLNVLRQIKSENLNNKFQLFGMALGSQVNPSNIKDCLKEMNGSPLTINANGKNVQSYFEVNVGEDIIKSFQKMFEAQSASIEEFNAKDEKRRELIEQQQVDADKMRDTLLKQYDQEYVQLQQELNKLQQDNFDSQQQGREVLKDIFDKQYASLQSKLEAQEKEIEVLNRVKLGYQEKIKNVKSEINNSKSEKDIFCASAGSRLKTENIEKNVEHYEEEIKQLGFTGKTHYDKLHEQLKTIDTIEMSLKFFSNQMTNSLNHLNQIKEFINEGIEQINEKQEFHKEDMEFYLFELLKPIDMNQEQATEFQNNKIKFIIEATLKDQCNKIINDKNLNYPFDALYQNLKLNDIFQLQNDFQRPTRGKNKNKNLTVDQYLIKLFKKLFNFNEQSTNDRKISKIKQKINKLEEKLEQFEDKIELENNKEEPNESQIEMHEKQQEDIEKKIEDLNEEMNTLEEKKEGEFQQFIKKNRKQYDFTSIVLRNIHFVIQLAEYQQRQSNIFMPLEMQRSSLEILNKQCEKLNTLAIQ